MNDEEKLNLTMDLLLQQEKQAQYFVDRLELEDRKYWEGKKDVTRYVINYLRSMGISSKR